MKKYPMTVTQKLVVSYLILITCMVVGMTSFSLFMDIRTLNKELDAVLTDFSYMLSRDVRIQNMIKEGEPNAETIQYLDDILSSLNKADVIVVADEVGIRLFHTERELIGQRFSGGDEGPILSGEEAYVTEGLGIRQKYQRRSFTAVHDEDQNVMGFVMVSAYKTSIQDMQIKIITRGVMLAILAFCLAHGLASWFMKSIKKSLLGYEPDQITKLYLQKNEVLDALEEGIFAVDKEGQCTLINESAKKIIKDKQSFIDEHIQGNLFNGQWEHNCEIELNGHAILMDKIPILHEDVQVGIVCLLKNKTELQELAEQLTGVKHLVSALRSNTHEYVNKLHVILGLLQMGQIDRATSYIEQTKVEEEEDFSLVMRQIKNQTLAALIIGKKRRAKERDIRMVLRKDSYLEADNCCLSTADFVTLLGNLAENAMDAVDEVQGMREITLFIKSFEESLTILVDDTGSGMTEEAIEAIREGNYSTKGEGRGTGLRLIQNIVQNNGGTLDIESEPGIGSSFMICIDKIKVVNSDGETNDKDNYRGR